MHPIKLHFKMHSFFHQEIFDHHTLLKERILVADRQHGGLAKRGEDAGQPGFLRTADENHLAIQQRLHVAGAADLTVTSPQ